MRDEARAFHREDEVCRHGGGPGAEALGILQPVMGGVDLDRGEVGAGIGEFVRLLQALGIKHTEPGRVAPSADPDADAAWLLLARHRLRVPKRGHGVQPQKTHPA